MTDYLEQVRKMANELVATASRLGIIVTIEQVPNAPLAMGNYTTDVGVRYKRGVTEAPLMEPTTSTTLNGVPCVAIPSEGCKGCAGHGDPANCAHLQPCTALTRADLTAVIWIAK